MVATGIIIQARTDSKRFPNKVTQNILNKPVITHVIERCKRIRNCDVVALATTGRQIDDCLATISMSSDIEIYRGEVDDVLNRYHGCAKKLGLTNIVRITGDCPLIDIDISSKVVKKFLDSNYDYIRTGLTYPDGVNTEIFSFDSLQRISAAATLQSEREHVTPYLWKHPDKFKILSLESEDDLSNFRFTVDHLDDLLFIRKIYAKLYQRNPFFGLNMILDMLRDDSHLLRKMPKWQRYEGYNKSLSNDTTLSQ
jgi:spore coat polysaccharide biosynthesis protein SpsF